MVKSQSLEGAELSLKALPENKKVIGEYSSQDHDAGKGLLGVLAGLFVCSSVCPCMRHRKKESNRNATSKDISSHSVSTSSEETPLGGFTPISSSSLHPGFVSQPCPKAGAAVVFTMGQLRKATSNFSPALKIGQGGFGIVYRGKLPGGTSVAIKRARKDSFEKRVTAEFQNEVNMLANVDHLNLVKLIGFLEEGNELIVVEEYVPNGNLRQHLDCKFGVILDLLRRLDIAIDIAHALTYLHSYADRPIIHRDVKSSNILLTDNFRAKVADFGFSRILPYESDATHVSTQVKGTAGYLDPEYLYSQKLTQKSDVYSFGILLVEIFTGRRPIEQKREADERLTIRWVFKKFDDGNIGDLLDPNLRRTEESEMVMERVVGLATWCAAPTKQDRPTMKQAAEGLWKIRKEYQDSLLVQARHNEYSLSKEPKRV